MKNIFLIDKPIGITSFDVIRKLRKELNIKKIGHAGALDPLASGLMILGLGEGTKKLKEYIKLDKVYEFNCLLGKKTTTGDLEGEVLEETERKEISLEKVKKVLNSLVGVNKLEVPIYSAVKKDGESLYKKARRGEKVELPVKDMEVYWIKLKGHHKEGKYYVLVLEAKVSSGTYIRSLSEKIGKELSLPATTSMIRRTEIGEFRVEKAENPPE
jgi:tRNA pseudouridine55 synthase